MSISSIQQKIRSLDSQIKSDVDAIGRKADEEQRKTQELHRAQEAGRPNDSATTTRSRQQKVSRIQASLLKIAKERSKLETSVSDKRAKLSKAHSELSAEQQKEYSAQIKRMEENNRRNTRSLKDQLRPSSMERLIPSGGEKLVPYGSQGPPSVDYDVFISHASEDKEEVAGPLAEELKELGLSVWFDSDIMKVGMSLREAIDQGIRQSRSAVVVFSPEFLKKNWTQYELNGLVQRQMSGDKVILPIWHRISKPEMIEASPSLADLYALNTSLRTAEEIAREIHEVLST